MIGEPSANTTLLAVLIGFLTLAGFFGVRTPEERRFLLPLALISFLIKAALVPVYYFVLVNAGLDGFAFFDSYEYHIDGIELMHEFANGIDYGSRAWRMIDPAYSMFTGICYYIVGPNTLFVRVLNVMFCTFTLLYVYRISRMMIEGDRAAKLACYLVAFLPYSIVIFINQRKEPLVAMLATFIFYHSMRLIRFERGWQFSILCIFSGIVSVYYFRSGFVPPFLIILLLCYFLASQSLVRGLMLAVPSVLVFVAVQFLISGDSAFSLASTAGRFQAKAEGSSDFAEVGGLVRLVRMNSIFEIYKLPLATFLLSVLPFPPLLKGLLPSVLLSWTNLLNLVFYPALLQGVIISVTGSEWRRRIPLVLFSGIFLALIAATHISVIRYRETVFPIMVILIALGLTRPPKPLFYFAVYLGLGLLGGLVYATRLL